MPVVYKTRFAEFGVGAAGITWTNATINDSLIGAILDINGTLIIQNQQIIANQNALLAHISTGTHAWSKITNHPFIHSGSQYVGDFIPTSGNEGVINIPFGGTINIPLPYKVFLTIRSNTPNFSGYKDNDLTWCVGDLSPTGFKILLNDLSNSNQQNNNISLDYFIYKT